MLAGERAVYLSALEDAVEHLRRHLSQVPNVRSEDSHMLGFNLGHEITEGYKNSLLSTLNKQHNSG